MTGTLEITVRNGQPNITIKLLDYANAKGDGGANAGFLKRIYECVPSPQHRVMRAIRRGAAAGRLRVHVARALAGGAAWDAASRPRQEQLLSEVGACEAVLQVAHRALRAYFTQKKGTKKGDMD